MKNKGPLRIALLVAFTLLLAEGITRVAGIKPGIYKQDPFFKPVDKLQILKGFYADSDGIQKISPDAAMEIAKRMNSFSPSYKEDECDEIYNLASVYRKAIHGSLLSPPDKEWLSYFSNDDTLSKLIVALLQHPINGDGYRSIPFTPYTGKRKKILLIGDSFTWGHSAEPVTNSFADLLLRKGYVVYNAGISGADPPQYAAVAKKYMALLKPDVVIVNVCLGNDIQFFDRPVKPGQPIYYSTNAGNLYANPNALTLSMGKSYELALAWHSIPAINTFNRFCRTTAIATLVWQILNKYQMVYNRNPILEEYEHTLSKVPAQPTATLSKYLAQIKALADSSNAKLITIAIPDFAQNRGNDKKEVIGWFNGFAYELSPVLQDGYNKNDGHFNNKGHLQYADFIEKKTKQLLPNN